MPLIIFLFSNSNNNNNNNVEAMCTFILSSVFTLFLSRHSTMAVLTVSLLYDYYLLVCKAVFLKDRSVSKTVNLWQ